MTATILVRVILTVLGFTALSAYSQGVFGLYDVNDVLSDTKKAETWFVVRAKNSPNMYISKKILTLTQESISTEITDITYNRWSRKVQTSNKEIYYEEVLASLPYELEPGESSYGYINVINNTTHKIIEAWPLFLTVDEVQGSKRATFTAYLPNNRIMEVVQIFVDEGYFFPSIQETKIYKSGVIPSTIPTIANPGWFLDTYIIAKRK